MGTTGGDVIIEELLLLVVEGAEETWLVEVSELRPTELEVLRMLEVVNSFVDVTVALTNVHGVVGLALAQAHRELAAPRTFPAETPQALITQFRAADWIAED